MELEHCNELPCSSVSVVCSKSVWIICDVAGGLLGDVVAGLLDVFHLAHLSEVAHRLPGLDVSQRMGQGYL